MRPARPATGGKSSQERGSHHPSHTKNSKSFTKAGSALAKTGSNKPSLHKLTKQAFGSPAQGTSSI